MALAQLGVATPAMGQELQRPAGPEGPPATTRIPVTAPGDTEVLQSERGVINPPSPPPMPLEEPIDPSTYVCGRGDTFELNFWGRQNFKLRITVDPEGRTFISKIGYVELVGKTLTEARVLLKSVVHRYYPGLKFDLSLAVPRTFLVHVVENATRPGLYPASPLVRLSTLLAQAGGVIGSRRRIEIHRRGGARLEADLLLYELTGSVRYNPFVLDGDVVRVPSEDLAVSVSGPVRRAGRYELVKSRDLAELLDLAGGLKSEASRRLPIRIVRRDENERPVVATVPLPTDGAPMPAVPLHDDDAVLVPSATELAPAVLLVGALAGASAADEATTIKRVPYVQGDTVRLVIERAGGVTAAADLHGSYVDRVQDGKVVRLPIDLEALLVRRDLSADRPALVGDAIVVPPRRRSVFVEGAVLRSGAYPFNPRFLVEEYLATAGGLSRQAVDTDEVRVVTPDGRSHAYRKRLPISPGDTIVVPERHFSRGEVVQIVLGTATLVASFVSVWLIAAQ